MRTLLRGHTIRQNAALLVNTNPWSSTHDEATCDAFRRARGEDHVPYFKADIRVAKMRNWTDWDDGVPVSECFTNCSSTGIFTTWQPSLGVYTERFPTENVQSSEQQLCGNKCLVNFRGQRSESTDWLEIIKRNQELHGLHNIHLKALSCQVGTM